METLSSFTDGTFRNPEGSPQEILMLNGHIKYLSKKENLI